MFPRNESSLCQARPKFSCRPNGCNCYTTQQQQEQQRQLFTLPTSNGQWATAAATATTIATATAEGMAAVVVAQKLAKTIMFI